MTKIIDLPTTASTDANTFVPVYKNGKTQKVSATALGGGGSGLDLTSTTDVPTVEGTEYIPLNKPLGTVFRVTVQRILDWILARANTWTANQTFNANLNFTGAARRITGNFSGTDIAAKTAIQTNVINASTSVDVIPSGTASSSAMRFSNSSTPENSSITAVGTNATTGYVEVGRYGTGAFLPLGLYTGNAERLRIDPTTGNVLATSGALGYGVGAGGTVVQATSKSSAVTLNKPSGRITTHNAALAAGATVSFSCGNSYVSDTSCVVVNEIYIYTDGVYYPFDSYQIDVADLSDGYFQVRIKNVTTRSLSDVLTVQFNVHPGAIS